jgi:hypothetical protein
MLVALSTSERLRRALLGAVLPSVAIVVALLASPTSYAGKPKASGAPASDATPVKGEWIDCNTVTESKTEGDHQLITVAIVEKFTGSFNGTYEGTERNVVRQDGSGTFKGSGVFTGEVSGRAGTAVMTYSGTVDKDGHAVAHWVLDQGTDALARIDGQGTFEGKQIEQRPDGCTDPTTQSAFAGTYSGTVQFLAR